MKRTDAEVQTQIEELKAIAAKPTFRRFTLFGDSNVEGIEAQVQVLEERWTEGDLDGIEAEEWAERTHDMAREAIAWRLGESEDKPVDGWKGLH